MRVFQVAFTEEWLLSGHYTIQAWLVECYRDGCSSGRFSSLHREMLELCQWPSGSWSPPWLRPFSPDRSVWPGSLKSPGGSKLFHLWMKATVLTGTFNAAEFFLYPSPDLCLDTIKVPFKESLFTRPPYLQRLRAAQTRPSPT